MDFRLAKYLVSASRQVLVALETSRSYESMFNAAYFREEG